MTFVVDLADAARKTMAYAATAPLGRVETLRWLGSHDASIASLRSWLGQSAGT